jgi:Holliday junction resolvasome RuvABC endonuclease subunit
MTLIGIDPGSTHMGVSIFDIDDNTLELKNIITYSIDASKVDVNNGLNFHITHRLNYLANTFYNILQEYYPVAITIENPFINRFRPGSVIPLAKNLALIENVTLDFDSSIFINRISPSEAKNAIGMKGGVNKDSMRDALNRHEIKKYLTKDIDDMTEHEIDATAICLSLYQLVLEFPHYLLPG